MQSPIDNAAKLHECGWQLIQTPLDKKDLVALSDEAFGEDIAGTRCLLDLPGVRTTAILLREHLMTNGLLSSSAVAVQAIAFDKTAATNWKVTWHQDVMFPLAQTAASSGYELPSRKDGVDYARPPQAVLERLLAIRLHIDDCDETNGPLRVASGSHRNGILRSAAIADHVAGFGETTVLAKAGDALLMKPLLLHASSPALEPRHRRVLHLVYHDGPAAPEPWHRSV